MTANVIIYTSENCYYCSRAKQLLSSKNINYIEIRVDLDPIKRDEMVKITGRRTVPQILINGSPVGGSDDLAALNASGELDRLINGNH